MKAKSHYSFPSRSEEHSQLQLVEREDIEDEEDLFEAIDKRNFTIDFDLHLFEFFLPVLYPFFFFFNTVN